MDRLSRYMGVNSRIRPMRGSGGQVSPNHTGSPLHSRNPVSSVRTAADSSASLPHASGHGSTGGLEGGLSRPARMKTRLLHILLAAGAVALALLAAFTMPAEAQQQTVYVRLPTGQVVAVQVDVPPGTPLDD